MKHMFSKDAKLAQLGFAENQTSHVESAVNEALHPDIQYPQLVPVDTSASEFARSVTYYSSDKYGKADWINGNSNDIPVAGSEMAKHEKMVYMAGVGYSWGFEELGQAMMLGRNLQADDAMAARRAYEEMVDRVALYGDDTKGFQGITNNTGVTVEAATNGDWNDATTTGDQMAADINAALLGLGEDVGFTSMANTLLVGPRKMERLGTVRMGDTSETVATFLREKNLYTATTGQPLTIRAVRGLDTAGAAGAARMIAYRRDPAVLKLHIPMPHRFLPVYQDGALNMVVPGVFRLGGVDIRRPKEVRYIDGI